MLVVVFAFLVCVGFSFSWGCIDTFLSQLDFSSASLFRLGLGQSAIVCRRQRSGVAKGVDTGFVLCLLDSFCLTLTPLWQLALVLNSKPKNVGASGCDPTD